jgi:hypothetical protein
MVFILMLLDGLGIRIGAKRVVGVGAARPVFAGCLFKILNLHVNFSEKLCVGGLLAAFDGFDARRKCH